MNDRPGAAATDAETITAPDPADPAVDAPPAVVLEQTLESEAPVFDPGASAKRGGDERRRETLALRTQYDAFIEQHHQAMVWQHAAAVGTIVAIEAEHAIMHVGRNHFVRFHIANDLHGTVPDVGMRVTVERDGSVAESEHDRSHVHEHGLGR